ncbi:MAG: DUF4124 domain-containing protein [Betaproteobacteria bacterium]
MYRWVLAALAVALPCLAVSQTIYKVQMPDGSVMFTDTPPPDAKILEQREGRSPARQASSPAPVPTVPATQVPAQGIGFDGQPLQPVRKSSALDAAIAEVNEAERALQLAKRKLELGREPKEGERLGLKGGGSRLTPEYEARLEGLERDVANAELRLQRAYEARNAAR